MSYRNAAAGLACSVTIAALSGCALGPDFEPPEIKLAADFHEPALKGESIANLAWWDVFQDPLLSDLVRTALRENKDLRLAAARIDESRALLGITRADQFPTIDVSGDISRTDRGDVLQVISTKPFNNFGLFGDLSYEIDLWGKLRRATEAQRAELLSSEYSYRAVTISLVSQVAQVYFRILDADSRLEITERTLTNRKEATRIINERFKGGTLPELDVNQAQIEEADVLAQIASIKREQRQLENAMSVLLGSTPVAITRNGYPKRELLLAQLPSGMPAELLARRPDILSAQEALHAETARIGVAIAQRLPAVSLTGFIGLESRDSSDLFSSDAKTWSIGGGLLGPLLDFGRARSRVEAAEARTAQAYYGYEQTVLIALQEVEDALIAIHTFDDEFNARSLQRKAASNAGRLSRARYDDGLAPYLEVLDIERSLLSAELASSSTMQQLLVSIVQLYKALGGGWTPPPAA